MNKYLSEAELKQMYLNTQKEYDSYATKICDDMPPEKRQAINSTMSIIAAKGSVIWDAICKCEEVMLVTETPETLFGVPIEEAEKILSEHAEKKRIEDGFASWDKPKQCKDCEEFVSTKRPPICSWCSKREEGRRDTEFCHVDCPNFGFCKKHEKFVDEYTECLDGDRNE